MTASEKMAASATGALISGVLLALESGRFIFAFCCASLAFLAFFGGWVVPDVIHRQSQLPGASETSRKTALLLSGAMAVLCLQSFLDYSLAPAVMLPAAVYLGRLGWMEPKPAQSAKPRARLRVIRGGK